MKAAYAEFQYPRVYDAELTALASILQFDPLVIRGVISRSRTIRCLTVADR
jgi:hypothetical protein